MIEAIKYHCEKNTEICSNREIKSGEGLIAVRSRHMKLWDLYMLFPASSQISFSTFVKYLPKNIKLPRKQTDVCGYCIRWKLLDAALKRLSKKLNSCCSMLRESMFFIFYYN